MLALTNSVRLTIVCVAALLAAAALWGAPQSRTISGRVTDANGKALQGAAVQVKNRRTLVIRSCLSEKDGRYEMVGLSLDTDYEIRAVYRQEWSSTKDVSRFDGDLSVQVDLVVPVGNPDGSGP